MAKAKEKRQPEPPPAPLQSIAEQTLRSKLNLLFGAATPGREEKQVDEFMGAINGIITDAVNAALTDAFGTNPDASSPE